ncbi:MAG: 23S rRNA (guanosine(2251)-2'-O)-methyltransferase RlmB [Deltaproteobacteria bacterium]|nr:23S rRNA (guanosine(2251)-2'-O)-methyltransferase RlmB [Deltaproteobacteria bacterium]
MMRTIYGVNPVMEALAAGAKGIERILVSQGRSDKAAQDILKAASMARIHCLRVNQDELTALAKGGVHQGVVAIMRSGFAYVSLDALIDAWKGSGKRALFLVLDSVQDPHNLGSLVRASECAGAHGVIIPKDRACEVTATVGKTSAGAIEHVPIAREVNISSAIKQLKEAGVWVAGVDALGRQDIYKTDLNIDVALVIGGEGKGIRRLVLENCDFTVSIPMAGAINSLNAAQAGTIALFEALRQRRK